MPERLIRPPTRATGSAEADRPRLSALLGNKDVTIEVLELAVLSAGKSYGPRCGIDWECGRGCTTSSRIVTATDWTAGTGCRPQDSPTRAQGSWCRTNVKSPDWKSHLMRIWAIECEPRQTCYRAAVPSVDAGMSWRKDSSGRYRKLCGGTMSSPRWSSGSGSGSSVASPILIA